MNLLGIRTAAWQLATAALLLLGGCAASTQESGVKPADRAQFDIQLYKGKAYLEKNNPEMALPALQEAKRLDPANVEVLLLLGRACDRLGRKEQALTALEQAAAARPNDPVIAHDHAVALLRLNRLEQAEAIFLKVLKDPAFPTPEDAYYNLGLLYQHKGEPRRMVEMMNAALRLQPALASAHDALAAYYAGMGQSELERRHLTALLEENPEDPVILGRLADSFVRSGEGAEARRIWERMVSVAPASEAAQRARQRLAMPLEVSP